MLKDYKFQKTARFLIFYLLFIFSIVISIQSYAKAEEAIGKFSYVEGTVDVLRGGSMPAISVKVGDPVFVKDIIRTKSGSRAELTFVDGNILRIAQRSRIDISEYVTEEGKGSAVIRLPRGKVQAIVPEERVKRISISPKANRFEIHTPNAVAGVRGTDYFVFYDKNITGVVVRTGNVYLYNPKFPDVVITVTPGNSSITTGGSPPQLPTHTTTTQSQGLENDVTQGKPTIEVKPLEQTYIGETPIAAIVLPPAPPPVNPTPLTPPITETNPGVEGVGVSDTTPPIVSISKTPPTITNSQSADFFLEANETATFSYRLDGGAWTSTGTSLTLTSLSEGNHTLDVKATDTAGNTSSPVSYSWTTDYTSPSLSKAALPEPGTNLSTVIISPNEPATYSYSIDGGALTQATGTVTLSGLDEGSHTLDYTATDTAGNTSSGSLAFTLDRHTLTGNAAGEGITGSVIWGGIAGVLNQNWGGWVISLSGEGTPSSSFTMVAGGSSTGSPDGFWLEKISDGAASGNFLSGTSSLTFLNPTSYGTGTGMFLGTYGDGNWQGTDASFGTYTETPLKFVSDVQAGQLKGLLGGTESLWTGSGPKNIVFMGKMSVGVGNRILDIHACDMGWSGGFWSTLLPGGVTHVYSLSNYNYVVDSTHPITQGVSGTIWGNWASHDYFTNLVPGTNIIFKDTSGNPTLIEYSFNGGNVLASTQTLEWGTFPALLQNIISYDTSGGGKVLLLQDVYPWGRSSNQDVLNSLVINYDVKSSLDFPSLDLSQYSTIIIASDQPQSFYDIMAANISKLEAFLSLGMNNNFIWYSPIFSYNYINSTYTTYDDPPGAYYGVIGGIKINNSMEAKLISLYIDPSGNAGYLRGSLKGTAYPDINMFEMDGTINTEQRASASEVEIPASALYKNIQSGSLDGTGAYLYGNFLGGGTIIGQETSGTTLAIYTQPWGIYSLILSGTYDTPTPSWSAKLGGQGSFGAYTDYWGDIQTDSGYWLADINGTWGEDKVGGTLSGKFLTRAKYGTIEGDLLGIYGSTTWQAISLGTWQEVTPLDFSGDVSGGLLYYEPSTLNYGGDVYGIIGGIGNIWQTGTAKVYLMGTYETYAGSEPYLAYGSGWYFEYPTISSNASTIGGAFKGYNVGLWNNGTIQTKALAIYIDPDKNAGYLEGDLTGNYYPGIGMWEMSGDFTKSFVEATTILPENLSSSLDYGYLDPSTSYMSGSFNGGGTITASYVEGSLIGLSGHNWGIWNAGMGGSYSGTTSPNLTAKIGSYFSLGGDYGYMLGDITSNNWGVSGNTFTGTVAAKFITPYLLGDPSKGTGITGDLFGSFDTQYWQAAGVGKWSGDPLQFVSDFYADILKIFGDGEPSLQSIASVNGLLGGTQSLWSGSDIPVTILGQGVVSGLGVGGAGLWYTSSPLYSHNYITGQYTTYDDPPGAYYGLAGGIGKKGNIEGKFIALYIDPEGKAGYLRSDLSGSSYADINMFEMSGTINREENPNNIRISASDLYSKIQPGSLDNAGAHLYGSFTDGTISGQEGSGVTYAIADQPWGIFGMTLFGTYGGTIPSWSANIGGAGSFGVYQTGGGPVSDEGYWLAEINDDGTSGDGILRGTLNGKFITYTKLGMISGDLLGKYSEDSWRAVSLGTWEGTPLTFLGVGPIPNEVDIYSEFKYYNGESLISDGYLYALMGGTSTLWSGSQVPATILGMYDPIYYNPGRIWNTEIHSFNAQVGNNITYDWGFFYGFLGGIKLDNGGETDNMEGKFVGLYVEPDGMRAGLLRGSLTGTGYRNIGMFEMDGNIISEQKTDFLGISPWAIGSDYESYFWRGSISGGSLYGNFQGEGVGTISSSYFDGSTIAIQTQPWGIYQLIMGGNYSGDTTPPWSGKIGGEGTFGAYKFNGVPLDDNGYWLIDITDGKWNNNRMAATASGKFLTPTKLGTMDGDLLGTYNGNGEGTWQAVALGTWSGTPLDFSGELTWGRFGYVSGGTGIWDVNSDISGLIGGTKSLWDGSPSITFVGLGTYLNPEARTLWDVDISGTTTDGGKLYISMGGISLNDTVEGRGIGLYIRPKGDSYEAGYLTSASSNAIAVTGNFYPGLGMWEASGNIIAVSMGTTIFTPDDLYWGNTSSLDVEWSYGVVGGAITGSVSVESLSLKDQNWGRWMAWLDGTYNYISPPSTGWTANAGGSTDFVNESEPGYWLVNITDGTWSGKKLTGTVSGTFITQTNLGTIAGDLLGTYDTGGTWQAVSLGTWEGSQLTFLGISEIGEGGPIIYSEFKYYDGGSMKSDGYLYALMGGTSSLWTGSSVPVTMIGEYSISGSNPGHIWTTELYSRNSVSNTNTTYYIEDVADIGSFRGYIGGTTLRNTETGKDDMEAMFVALYIDPAGNAGFLRSMHSTGDSFKGTGYPGIMMFEMDGKINRTQMISDIGITPENLSSSIWEWKGSPWAHNLFVSGTLKGKPISYGLFDMNTMSLVDYNTPSVAQQWGIYSQDLGGRVNTLGTGTTWSAEMGGRGVFGAYNLNSMKHGFYSYDDGGFYNYSFYNKSLSINLGYAYYRSPHAGVISYDKTYTPSGQVNVTNYAYGDPYGYGYKYYYVTGTSIETWDTTKPLKDVLQNYAPGGSISSSFGAGKNDTGFFINHIEGDAEEGRLTGSVNGRFINYTQLGTISGEVLGNYDESNNTWQAVSLGTWEGQPLSFRSGFTTVPFYFNGVNAVEDGYMNAPFGGITSLWGSSSVSATIIGEYGPGKFPEIGHVWSADVRSVNFIDGTNTTYDGGAFRGYIGGTTLRNTETGNDDMEAMFVALYIDPSGNAGFLRSMPSGDSFKGTGYPGIMMFEMDGKIERIEMQGSIGISPQDLMSYISIISEIPPVGGRDSGGVFIDTNYNTISDMLNRGDNLQFAKIQNTNFGIWRMDSFGKFTTEGDTWVIWSNPKIEIYFDGYSYPSTVGAYQIIAFGGQWSNNKFTGNAIGYGGMWNTGKTFIIAGETIGTYDDVSKTFSSFSAGASIETSRFLSMVSDSDPKLTSLGFPTTLKVSSDVNLSVSTPGVNVKNMRIFSPSTGVKIWICATDEVSGTYNGSLPDIILDLPLKNSDSSHPIYGRFFMDTAATAGIGKNNWLGEIWGLGVFKQVDESGSYIQGNFDAVAAGTYTSNTFAGSAAGFFTPITFLSEITNDSSTAYLNAFNGSTFVTDGTDGYFKGLLGPDNPLTLWSATPSSPLSISMVGLYEGSDLTYENHIFSTQIYPKNFTTNDPDKLYTTTDGGSFKGYLSGILLHRTGFPDMVEGRINAIYIDPTRNAGILMGKIGGDEPDYWGEFKKNYNIFEADGDMYPVQMVPSIGISPENLMSQIEYNSYSGTGSGQFQVDGGGSINVSNINISSMNITNQNWGVWSGMSGGTYSGLTSNDWSATIDLSTIDRIHQIEVSGTKWQNDVSLPEYGKIVGTTTGYGADISSTPKTWISVGETLGTFNPTTYTFQTLSMGPWIETNKFLAMANTDAGKAALQKLNIPCVEVGMVNMSGNGNNLMVNMNNVKFFAPTTGGRPSIWATGNVNGSYSANPVVGVPVGISGNGLSSDFTVQQWNTGTNRWLSTISNGTGSITGGGLNVQYLNFKGAGAGTINQGASTFSGTAAGVSK